MKNHSLEIFVQPDNTALCFICSPAYGDAVTVIQNPCQRLTLSDGQHRVSVLVANRKLNLEDIKRIARQAVDREFESL